MLMVSWAPVDVSWANCRGPEMAYNRFIWRPSGSRGDNRHLMADTQLLLALGITAAAVGLGFWGYSAWHSHQLRQRRNKTEWPEEQGSARSWEVSPDGRLDLGPGLTASPQGTHAGQSAWEHPPTLHRQIDLIIALAAPDPVDLARVREALIAEFADANELPMRWYFFDDAQNQWSLLTIDAQGSAQRLIASLLLCNRSGPIGEREYSRFTGGTERVADRLGLACDRIEPRASVLRRAQALDRLCQSVDWQVVINLKPRSGTILGTKVRAAAEAFGMKLDPDGAYRLYDEQGYPLFTLIDARNEPFIAAEMRVRQVPALSLICEIALIPAPSVFDRMVGFAEKLTRTLDAELVADDGTPLTADRLRSVRAQIEKSHQEMRSHEIAPGSAFARRLFS